MRSLLIRLRPCCSRYRGILRKDLLTILQTIEAASRGHLLAMEYIMVPSSFVLDAVEVMRSTTEYKRLPASVDASYVLFPPAANSYKGHTVYRIVDEAATAKAGRTILQDTNNSLADFAISDHQLLKDE
jgi:hypothetical protein